MYREDGNSFQNFGGLSVGDPVTHNGKLRVVREVFKDKKNEIRVAEGKVPIITEGRDSWAKRENLKLEVQNA